MTEIDQKMLNDLNRIELDLRLDLTAEFGEGGFTLVREFAIARDSWEFTAYGTVAGKKVRMDGEIAANDTSNPLATAVITAGWWASIVFYLNEYWPEKENNEASSNG